MQPGEPARTYDWNWRHFAALLLANVALALGPWSVRLADSGPVSAGFWRLFLALPILLVLALANRQPVCGYPRGAVLAFMGGGLAFALDIASWHIGIGMTRLGNVTLFGNSGSLIVMAWGIIALRRWPYRAESLALGAAFAGAAILFGRSLEIGTETFVGDLFCLLAGFFYAFYIILLQSARRELGNWALLFWSSLTGVPVLLGIALALGEPVWPQTWWPLIVLSLGSQVLGQGLLVYSLRHFPPLVIGLMLLTQPGIAVIAGWYAFSEELTLLDGLGMALVAAALVIVRASERPPGTAN
ncbi:MAG: DMT family transporter [Novosphingobium sp.]|nr:DMT family transporter [Novosphingobium sp.]